MAPLHLRGHRPTLVPPPSDLLRNRHGSQYRSRALDRGLTGQTIPLLPEKMILALYNMFSVFCLFPAHIHFHLELAHLWTLLRFLDLLLFSLSDKVQTLRP